MNFEAEPRSSKQSLYFDPDEHPESTLKAFNEFCNVFTLRYDALYPDPPKVSMDAAISRWKLTNTSEANPDPVPTVAQYDLVRNTWRNRDKVVKFLGLFSSQRFQKDWSAAQPDEALRDAATWTLFKQYMTVYYRPTENPVLKNYLFRSLTQGPDETITAWCNRVELEASHCQFKCDNPTCTSESISARDQIIIGTHIESIRDRAMMKNWDLATVRLEGMKIESASRGSSQIGTESVNKVGKFSYKNVKNQTDNQRSAITCHFCGDESYNIRQHRRSCAGNNNKCTKCSKFGHLPGTNACTNNISAAPKRRGVKAVDATEEVEKVELTQPAYNVNLFVVKSSTTSPKPKLKVAHDINNNFSVQVIINNSLDKVLADTGAKVSVCGTVQANKWRILDRTVKSSVKIQPYKSDPIPVHGIARCAVSFGNSSIPVEWHIISGSCEPILSGKAAQQLGIIQFNGSPDTFEPVNMINDTTKPSKKESLQNILSEFPENFQGIGCLRGHQVRLHIDKSVKPVVTPPRTTPYHLEERVDKVIDEMIVNDVIEKLPENEPAEWISCSTIVPKPDGDIRMTLDCRNINKALQSSNLPIPRQEDIKAKLSGAKIFSKLDFKSAFWQLELHPDSRNVTVFHRNNKLYRYKRLTMGLKPAQGELNAALAPIFSHICNAHLIHDDLIIATKTYEEHESALRAVMQAVSNSGLTLNPKKCVIASDEINFWGLLITSKGVRPDPAKVAALDHISHPTNRQDLISFLCMMQSNAEFIPNFAQKAECLRKLVRGHDKYNWSNEHEQCFNLLVTEFRNATLLRYFDLKKHTFIIVDAHLSGLGATLAQGDSIDNIYPIAFASRSTKPHERRYPQLDLEALSVNFGLTRFRNYLVGSPSKITVITDHKPL